MKKAFLHLYSPHKKFEAVLAFGEGLKQHGWNVEQGDTKAFKGPYDLIVQWNCRVNSLFTKERLNGAEICVLETSYIEPRCDYVSVSFGKCVNNRNRFYGPFEDPWRWKLFFADRMQPPIWRDEGYVLLMGQMPGDMALRKYVNFFDWIHEAYTTLTAAGHKVLYRGHPNQPSPVTLGRRQKQLKKLAKTCVQDEGQQLWQGYHRAVQDGMKVTSAEEIAAGLQGSFKGAKAVVTFNSNSGVDAALHGLPVVAVDKGSMARDVASNQLLHWFVPDEQTRLKWAYALAWKQWTLAEMESGDCWAAACPPALR